MKLLWWRKKIKSNSILTWRSCTHFALFLLSSHVVIQRNKKFSILPNDLLIFILLYNNSSYSKWISILFFLLNVCVRNFGLKLELIGGRKKITHSRYCRQVASSFFFIYIFFSSPSSQRWRIWHFWCLCWCLVQTLFFMFASLFCHKSTYEWYLTFQRWQHTSNPIRKMNHDFRCSHIWFRNQRRFIRWDCLVFFNW